ncbi:MAG: hypothetical protein ACK5L5_05000 [Bacteroidales bacterium]
MKQIVSGFKLAISTSIFFVITVSFISSCSAQRTTTVRANSADISDNLDLKAVASIFGDSQDLEDFEYRLNDPENRISNLDLNRDGYVDYLRVLETAERDAHVIAIQAVLGEDFYQDVASIDVQRENNNRTVVQIVGDPYIYGTNYIYEPAYVSTPHFFSLFWSPGYVAWNSSFYWGFYPRYYTAWRPSPVPIYRKNVYVNINVHNSYHYTNVRRSSRCADMHRNSARNDYASRNPERSFSSRNSGISNRNELTRTASSRSSTSRSGAVSSGSRSSSSRGSGTRATNSSSRSRSSSGVVRSSGSRSSSRSSGTRATGSRSSSSRGSGTRATNSSSGAVRSSGSRSSSSNRSSGARPSSSSSRSSGSRPSSSSSSRTRSR